MNKHEIEAMFHNFQFWIPTVFMLSSPSAARHHVQEVGGWFSCPIGALIVLPPERVAKDYIYPYRGTDLVDNQKAYDERWGRI